MTNDLARAGWISANDRQIFSFKLENLVEIERISSISSYSIW